MKISLKGVKVFRGCSKPNCRTGSTTINRHHRKHEAMWLGIWASRRKGEPEWKEFVDRYWQFLEEDIEVICVSHHAEIHVIYDEIIKSDLGMRSKPLSKYTWDEAHELMTKLDKACHKWIKNDTPGISSELYGSYKERSNRKQAVKRRRKGG